LVEWDWPFAFSLAETSTTPGNLEEAEEGDAGTVRLFCWDLSAECFVILEAALPDFFAPALGTRFRAFDLTIVLVRNDEPIQTKMAVKYVCSGRLRQAGKQFF